jgi:hypothetical protein
MATTSKRPAVKQAKKLSGNAAVGRLSRPLEQGTSKALQKAGAKLKSIGGGIKSGETLGADNNRANIRKRVNNSLVSRGKKPLPMYKGKSNAN